MPDLPGFLRTVQGSGMGYVLAALCIAALLVLRARTADPSIRRRATAAILLFVLFALPRLPLAFHLSGPTVVDLKGQTVASPPFQILSVLSIVVFALGLFLVLVVLLVDVILVGG